MNAWWMSALGVLARNRPRGEVRTFATDSSVSWRSARMRVQPW
jgi:hypothetical protein